MHAPPSTRRRSDDDVPDTAKISSGQISLSPVLASAMAKGVIDTGLTADTVVPQLAQNLEWRVTDTSGNEVETQQLADAGQLRVSVVSRDVQPIAPGQEHEFPAYGPWTEYAQATAGKVGGLQQ
jgi:tyrosinase